GAICLDCHAVAARSPLNESPRQYLVAEGETDDHRGERAEPPPPVTASPHGVHALAQIPRAVASATGALTTPVLVSIDSATGPMAAIARSRRADDLPRECQHAERVRAGDQVVDHHADASAEPLARSRGKRLHDVEQPEQKKSGDEHADRGWERQDGQRHTGDLVDDDGPVILSAERTLGVMRGPGADDRDEQEEDDETGARERHEPDERDG